MSKDAYKSELFKKRKKNEPITFPWVDELKTSLLYNAYKNIPKEEVTNLIYWRQLDATRNSIQMVGQANFSHKELQNKSCNIQDDV